MSASSPANIFNPRLVIGVIAAGILGFGALMLLLAFGDNIGSGRTGRANALSVSAVGYKGLFDLTNRLRHAYLDPDADDTDPANLLVVALEPQSRRADLERLLEARGDRPTLIILPKWYTQPDPERRGWVRAVFPGMGQGAASAMDWPVQVRIVERPGRSTASGTGLLAGLTLQVPASAQAISGANVRALVPLDSAAAPATLEEAAAAVAAAADKVLPGTGRGTAQRAVEGLAQPPEKPLHLPPPAAPAGPPSRTGEELEGDKPLAQAAAAPVIAPVPTPPEETKPSTARPASPPALVAQLGERPHYVLADPDLLNNHGLADPARAQAALALLDRLNAPGETAIGFDLTMNGYGTGQSSGSLLRTAFEPPFLAMTLALFVAALLAGLHGAFRFGPARREERAIAFGKAALVENSAGLIRLAGREARLGGAYADVMRQEMARATAAPTHLQGEDLDRYLNRLGKDGPTFSELAANLATAPDRHTLMSAAKALWDWRKTVLK